MIEPLLYGLVIPGVVLYGLLRVVRYLRRHRSALSAHGFIWLVLALIAAPVAYPFVFGFGGTREAAGAMATAHALIITPLCLIAAVIWFGCSYWVFSSSNPTQMSRAAPERDG
jgi:hypothetical protein